MTQEIKQSPCFKDSKFGCSRPQNVISRRASSPHLSSSSEWTRNAPMGALINPKVVPKMKSTSDKCDQTSIEFKETVVVPKRPVIPRDYDVNPRLKTMYQYHYNDKGDALLGYCDNRTVQERIRYFKNCQRVQDDLLISIKEGNMSGIRRYRSNYNHRISEYMAETSFIGAQIMKNRIHDHSKCGTLVSRCVHYIDF